MTLALFSLLGRHLALPVPSLLEERLFPPHFRMSPTWAVTKWSNPIGSPPLPLRGPRQRSYIVPVLHPAISALDLIFVRGVGESLGYLNFRRRLWGFSGLHIRFLGLLFFLVPPG